MDRDMRSVFTGGAFRSDHALEPTRSESYSEYGGVGCGNVAFRQEVRLWKGELSIRSLANYAILVWNRQWVIHCACWSGREHTRLACIHPLAGRHCSYAALTKGSTRELAGHPPMLGGVPVGMRTAKAVHQTRASGGDRVGACARCNNSTATVHAIDTNRNAEPPRKPTSASPHGDR